MMPHIETILRGAGMSPYEIKCNQYKHDIDLPMDDDDPGFGIIGPTGTGKTVAIAKHMIDWVIGFMGDEPRLAPNNFAVWSNWPDEAENIKSLTGPANWDQLENLEWRMKTCGRLYLDDIGQERIRGEDDFSLGHLRTILDSRYRAGLPVIWTSNLKPEQLSATYGARTVSRMIQAWPPIMISGPDRRLT